MNRLKYVLGINVPRRLPPSATFSKSHFKGTYKRNQSDACATKTARLLTSRLRKFNELRSFHGARPRNGNEPTHQQASFPVHRSPTFLKRGHIGRRYSVRSEGLTEKEPRTYAQMIKFYSETKYGGPNSTTMIGIHKSPFSTASSVPQKCRNISKNSRNSNICAVGLNAFNQDAKFSSEAGRNLIDNGEEHTLGRPTSSYAKMIEKYSNAILHNFDIRNRHVSLVPTRNVSTRLHAPTILMGSRDVSARYFLSDLPSDAAYMSETKVETTETKSDGDWGTNMDELINDFKPGRNQPVCMKKKAADKPPSEPAQWLDRVMDAHKKKIIEHRTASKPVSDNSKSVEDSRVENPLEIESMRSDKQEMTLDEEDQVLSTDLKPRPEALAATKHPSNPIVDYIKRGPVKSNTTSQGSAHAPTTVATSSGRKPQIELRMTPSQNESVVSINMDAVAAKAAGAAASEQLSVVISSKRNKSAAAEAARTPSNANFGSMHVSISESTVPVKQIEFSINGKPVSELKSILARADKLDVVSSMDQVEIRIPSKSGSVANAEPARNVVSATQGAPTPVLNLQIAAKFNEPRLQQPRGHEVKSEIPQVPQRPPPATPPLPRSPPVAPTMPPKPSRPQNVFNPNSTTSQVPPPTNTEPATTETKVVKDVDITNVTNAKGSDNVHRTEDVASLPADKPQTPVRKDENTVRYVSRITYPTVKPDDPLLRHSSTGAYSKNAQHQLSQLKNPKPKPKSATDNRVASNMIPWWSSENSFNNIKKYSNSTINKNLYDDFLRRKAREQANWDYGQKASIGSKHRTVSTDVKGTNIPGAAKKVEKSDADRTSSTVKISKSTASSVRVKSPQRRWVPIKTKSGVRVVKYGKPANLSTNKFVKKNKYGRTNTYAGTNATKKDSETLTIPAVNAPKIVKYVSVTPQRAIVDKKSDSRMPNLSMQRKPSDKSRGTGDPKKGGSTADKPPEVSETNEQRITKISVRRPSTAGRDEKYSANKIHSPANVRSRPATANFGFGANKKPKPPETNATRNKNLPGVPVKEDPRIKEIMRTMKPIEKKKDGTLIDYGVIVPSRKPVGQIRQIPNVQEKDVPAQQEKLAEDKNAPMKVEVVEQGKNVLASKKTDEAAKGQTDKPGQPAKSSPEKKPEKTVVITVNEDKVEIRNVNVPKSKVTEKPNPGDQKKNASLVEMKKNTGPVDPKKTAGPGQANKNPGPFQPNRNPGPFQPNRNPGPVQPNRNPGPVPPNRNPGPVDPKKSTGPVQPKKSTTIPGEQKKNPSAIEEKKKSPIEQKTRTPLISVKMGDNVEIKRTPDSASRTLPVNTDSETKKQDSGGRVTGEAPLKGTVLSPVEQMTEESAAKPPTISTPRTEPKKEAAGGVKSGLSDRRTSDPLKKKDDPNPLKLQNTSSKPREGGSPAGNNADVTGLAPLRGTINFPPSETQSDAGKSADVPKDKTTPDTTLTSTTKTTGVSGGDNVQSKPDGGPSTLKMIATESPESCSNAQLDASNEGTESRNDTNSGYVAQVEAEVKSGFFESEPERPEKSLLYSSWLQRFKDRLDGNKLI